MSVEEQRHLAALVELLQEYGLGLGRPAVDTIASSRHANMKELRAGTTRTLFAFDPLRNAILLLGGDKSGKWNDWYRTAVPDADDLYDAHLETLKKDGLI
ncbi:MAG: type II toxin-antitoxin system RelE/ParE family toxin [Acidimicrobiaceae bacterium]|nr:type II toxin-antitoxin system RelE/ParE family toxin [Acidimicrobiaceae bacterium]